VNDYTTKVQTMLASAAYQSATPAQLKHMIGSFIYSYIEGMVGSEIAPKITGMVIDLHPAQLHDAV